MLGGMTFCSNEIAFLYFEWGKGREIGEWVRERGQEREREDTQGERYERGYEKAEGKKEGGETRERGKRFVIKQYTVKSF